MRSSILNHLPYPVRVVVSALVLCLMTVPAVLIASPAPEVGRNTELSTKLWPRFSMPRTVFVVDARSLSNSDLVTATTLQGIYNAVQRPSRLYLNWRAEDDFWITQLPKTVHVINLPLPGNQDLVEWLLKRFRSDIKGAIVTNPSNPDTVNLATSMAGLDSAVVINPDQVSMVAALGIKVLFSFDTADFSSLDPVATYQWGVDNLLSQTSIRTLTMLPGTHGGDRDYAVATKSFVFYLTSTNAAQKTEFGTILSHTSANTPIMGYIPNENPDVAYLSSQGHFLNPSDNLSNGTVWASMPAPWMLHESTEPAPIYAQPNTVYVAFLVTDGDNAQYMEHRMAQVWQMPDLGTVPEGWMAAPGTVEFAPTLLQYFNDHLPRNSELNAGASGIGYASMMSGPNLTTFAQLTKEIMQRTDMKTVYMTEPPAYLDPFAESYDQPGITTRDPLLETQVGDTVAFGQSSGYITTAQGLFCSLNQQSKTIQPGQPLFLEPQVDAWTLTPTDVLHVAQQLAIAGQSSGIHYVFTTPTELALTMQRYYAGQEAWLPNSNVQSMTGEGVLAEHIVAPSFPTSPVQITGPNLIMNPSGVSGTVGWNTSGGSGVSATTYQGEPALHWTSDNTTAETWVHYNTTTPQKGLTYTFSVDVAGTGQVFMDVFSGGDSTTLPVNLTDSYQHLTWTITIPSNATFSALHVRDSGAGPVSAYFRNASIAASKSPCL